MSVDNQGTYLQKELASALKDYQEEKPSFWYRFYDSKSAGRFLPKQPGDFFWLLPGVAAILIEAKSTTTGAPLQKLLEPGQCGKHRLWRRGGGLSVFVYYNEVDDLLMWCEGKDVLEGKQAGECYLWKGRMIDIDVMLSVVADKLKSVKICGYHKGCSFQVSP